MPPMTFSDFLKRHRADRKLSQSGLADLAGISVRSIQAYEQSARDPSLAQAITIASALCLKVGAFDPMKKPRRTGA